MKVQWYGLLHLSPRHLFLLTALTSLTRQTRHLSAKLSYTSSMSNTSSRSATGLTGYVTPLYNTLAVKQPPPDLRSRYAHQARSTCRRYPNPSPPMWACRQCTQFFSPRFSPLSPSFSPPFFPNPLFGGVPGAPQALARPVSALHCPRPQNAFLAALAKDALPPRVVAR